MSIEEQKSGVSIRTNIEGIGRSGRMCRVCPHASHEHQIWERKTLHHLSFCADRPYAVRNGKDASHGNRRVACPIRRTSPPSTCRLLSQKPVVRITHTHLLATIHVLGTGNALHLPEQASETWQAMDQCSERTMIEILSMEIRFKHGG